MLKLSCIQHSHSTQLSHATLTDPLHAPQVKVPSSNMCLGILTSAELGLWTCSGQEEQVFAFTAAGTDGSYRMHPKRSPGMCVEVASRDSGAGFHQWSCDSVVSQRFNLLALTPPGERAPHLPCSCNCCATLLLL